MKNTPVLIAVLTLATLCACGKPPSPPPPPPPAGFSLTLEPSSFKVGPAGEIKAVVRVVRNAGFTEGVQLSFENLPADITATFDPNPATGDSSTVRLTTSAQSSARKLELNLKGVAGAAQASAKGALEVTTALPPPTVTLDPSLKPGRPALVGIGGGAPRPLATAVDGKGNAFDFAENELILVTDDPAELNAFLARYNGTVLRSTTPPASIKGLKPAHHVKVNLDSVDAGLTAGRLGRLEPGKTGQLRISSLGAQRLVGVFAQERLSGLNVALNFTTKYHTFNDGVSQEKIGEGDNAMEWSYFRRGGNLDIDVASAWKALERAGKLGNKVRIGIVDEGFSDGEYDWTKNPDMPTVKATRGIMRCDGDCKNYHGHKVALAAAGLADNSYGAAGPAGPIAELVFSGTNLNDVEVSEAYDLLGDVPDAAEMGAKIINMSFGAAVPALVSAVVIPIEDMTQALRASGVLLFASAGNDGEFVDATDCVVVCWEEEWHTPCENDGVICVGGLASNERSRHPNSNYGLEDVDIWAPFSVYIGPSPDNRGDVRRVVSGTSYSSPFVAGVAALVWAADPNLSANQVWGRVRDNGEVFFAGIVMRQVKAFKAVSAVLGNTPPYVNITSPDNGGSQDAALTNKVTLKAEGDDLENNCCTYSWSSDLDGNMGSGSPIEFNFEGRQGRRAITVTAKDSQGRTATDTVYYTIRNVPPTVDIDLPTAGASYLRDQTFLLRGKGTDYTPFPDTLPCSSLRWKVKLPNTGLSRVYTGCEHSVGYDTVGDVEITLEAADPDGAIASKTVNVTLKERPPGSWVEITNPLQGAILEEDTSYRLQAKRFISSSGQFAPTVVEYKWELISPNYPLVTLVDSNPVLTLGLAWTPGDTHPIVKCDTTITVAIRVTMKLSTGDLFLDANTVKVRSKACVPN